MPLSASINGAEDITKIDFGSFSSSINSFVYIATFPKLVELTIRNTNLITFIDGFAGNRLNLSNKNSQPILFVSGYNSDCSITQPIIGSGGIKKIGTGKLSLRGVNLYSGTTEITEGVLEIETGVLGSGNHSGNIVNNAQFSIITPTAQTISGIISGTGVINIGGNVSFVNDNTYSGGTSILAGGRLSISRQTSGALTTASILNAGILDFSGTIRILVPINISGSGQLTKNGSNTVVFIGSNSYTGATTLNSGTILFEKVSSLYSGTQANWTKDKIIVNSGAVFGINAGGTGEFSTSDIAPLLLLASSINNNGFRAGSSIAFDTSNAAGGTFTISNTIPDSTGTGAGNVGVIKLGTNELVLSGANTFNGQLVVSSGTLSANSFNNELSSGPLGASSLPIDVGSLAEATIKYTGGAGSSNKKFLLSSNGGILEIVSAITLELSGIISGTGTLKKTGIGTLALSGTNTFSGATQVIAGVLNVRSSSALGTSSSQVSVSDGAAIQLQGNVVISGKNISVVNQGVSSTGVIRSISGNNTWEGNITTSTSLQVKIQSDAGLLTLSGNINFSSTGAQSLNIAGPGNILISGIISSTSTGGVLISTVGSSNGVLTLTGNNTFSGILGANSGTISISSIANSGSPSAAGTGNIAIGAPSGTGTIIYTGPAATSNKVITLGGGDSRTMTITQNGTGLLTLTGALTSTVGTGVKTLALNGTGAGEITGIISATAGTLNLVKSGTGTWVLSGVNTYAGSTTVSSGYLIAANASALGTIATATTVSSGGSLQIRGNITLAAEPLTISGTGVASDGALANLSGANSLSGAITLAAASRINSIAGTLTISGAINSTALALTCGGAGNLTLSGIITLTTGGLTYDGTGILILSAANVYTGATSINSGIVRISNASALGTAGTINVANNSQLEISGAITFARAVTIDGVGATSEGAIVNRSGNNTFSGAITLGAGTTSEIGCAAGILTLSGNITGTGKSIIFDIASGAEITSTGQIALTAGASQGNLNKLGAGTLTLSGTSNTYAGLTIVALGILRVTNSSAFGTSTLVSVEAGATLQLSPTVASTFSKPIMIGGTGSAGQGALINSALNNTVSSLSIVSFGDNWIASESTLTLTINGITAAGGLGSTARPLRFVGAGTITLSGIINLPDAGSNLVQNSTGTTNLGNFAHNYNGATTITTGTLTRVVTNGSTTATGTFTSTTLAVAFTAVPAIGSTWKFFPIDTTNTYASVSLTGATGRTGTYNRITSTLTIA